MGATAVIAAAGSGERLGAGGPKAFVEVAGRTLLEWSLAAFDAASSIDAVVVAVPAGCEERVGGGAVAVAGGASRSESVRAALERVETDMVVVHDAARPLVTPELIDAVVAALEADPDCKCVVAATPVTDTIKKTVRSLRVERTLDRSSLWAAQTPQAFRTAALREGLEATSLLAQATDDAMLVERIGGQVVLHDAPPENFKVTTQLDLRFAELLLSDRAH